MMYVGMMAFYPIPAVAVALMAATVADAASVATGRACYADPSARKDTVTWAGSGFTPGGLFQAALDGATLDAGSGTVDAAGAAAGGFAAPSLNAVIAPGTMRHTFRLTVLEGANAPTTSFTVSKLRASFTPAAGNPRTLRVRFVLHGFGLAGASAPAIYAHYVRPSGRVRTTVRLGSGKGACGALTTKRRRLFPFAPTRGTWTLQFDTARAYVRGSPTGGFLFYRVPVRIR
jgi:hypothetical protein